MRVVIDTNVIVSRFLSSTGPPAQIIDFMERGAFEIVVSEDILAEYQTVLAYNHVRRRHRLTDEQIAGWTNNLRRIGTVVAPIETHDVIKGDRDDNKFVECAVAGGADYIVSGDIHLLSLQEYQGIQILPPSAFLMIISQA